MLPNWLCQFMLLYSVLRFFMFSDFHVLACKIVRLSNVMISGGSELVPLHHSLPLNHFYEKLIVHAHECIFYTKKEKGC